MGRVWRPVRFFAEEDGVQKPTLLFLIFAVLIGIGAWAGGILIWRDVQSQRYADSILTRTPTVTATVTPTATVTLTPTITLTPTLVPSSTPYVYDDPATWELEEVTNVHGEVVLDFTRAQKVQIEHAFREYYEVAWRSMEHFPDSESIQPYLTREEYEAYLSKYYDEAIKRDAYLIYPPSSEIGIAIVYLERDSKETGEICALLIAQTITDWFTTEMKISEGTITEMLNYGYAEMEVRLIFQEQEWKIYKYSIKRY